MVYSAILIIPLTEMKYIMKAFSKSEVNVLMSVDLKAGRLIELIYRGISSLETSSFNAGSNDYISKPFKKEQLLAVVSMHIHLIN